MRYLLEILELHFGSQILAGCQMLERYCRHNWHEQILLELLEKGQRWLPPGPKGEAPQCLWPMAPRERDPLGNHLRWNGPHITMCTSAVSHAAVLFNPPMKCAVEVNRVIIDKDLPTLLRESISTGQSQLLCQSLHNRAKRSLTSGTDVVAGVGNDLNSFSFASMNQSILFMMLPSLLVALLGSG